MAETEAHFGKLLRALREKNKKTQLQLQMSLQDLAYPIDATTLSKYESGERRPDASFIPFFARALGLSSEDEKAILHVYIEALQLSALEDYLKGKSNVH